MSNYLAPAHVTAALRLLLREGLALDDGAVGGVPSNPTGPTVIVGRPDEIGNRSEAAINIYLYQVTPNAQWRNQDLPTRSRQGQLRQRPRTAVDLHYLLTFYGDEAQLEPQRLMGSAVHILHDTPQLTEAILEAAQGDFAFLAPSNLAAEIERVKFTPQLFSLEELSKLWSVLLQTEYSLSIAYIASVILIEPVETAADVLPVLERVVDVVPHVDRPAPNPAAIDDLALWLQSDAGLTFDVAGVSEWLDQAGQDRHAAQTDANRRPRLLARRIGLRPALRFDGSDDRLDIDWTPAAPIAAVTVAVVVRLSPPDGELALSFDGNRLLELRVSSAPPNVRWQTTDSSGDTDLQTAPLANSDRWHVIFADYDSATAQKQIIIDGQEPGVQAAHANRSLGDGAIPAGQIVATGSGADAGELAELIVYERALSSAEREQLEQYFARRYR